MKNILTFIGVLSVVFLISSYKSSSNKEIVVNSSANAIIPLKQKQIVVVSTTTKANNLLKKGYILQDVDVSYSGVYDRVLKFYTLIKY